jgi:formate hydrogenlyase transcriptional activator
MKIPPLRKNVSGEGETGQDVVDNIPILIWSADPYGRIHFLNQRWREYTGLPLHEIRGQLWVDLACIHPEDKHRLIGRWHAIHSSLEAGEAEARMKRFDGQYRWFAFRVVPFLDETGRVLQWYGANIDVEDRKRAEATNIAAQKESDEVIRRTEQQYRQIVETIPHFISVTAPDGSSLYSNKIVLEYTGLSLEDFASPDFRTRIIHPEDLERVREERRQRLRGIAPFELEQRVKRYDGQYRWFLIRYSPLIGGEGELLQWYVTAVDIDERKKAEERVKTENIVLREEIDKTSMFGDIVGNSERLRQVLAWVDRVARTESTVLLTGETGTGKELIARAIHKRSQRAERAFIGVNCAAIPQSLIASELFGHEKGAFTGALQRRIGRFELADGGTIFLDEIGELPVETQITLLRVLQEREFERVGGTQSVKTDTRIIAATNRDLNASIASGTFRSDLFYRLNVFPVEVPPLRERKEDIAMLVQYFIERYSRQMGKQIRSINRKTLALLQSYAWPGNIRELQNVIERSIIICETEDFVVDERWVCKESMAPAAGLREFNKQVMDHEQQMIEAALSQTNGRVSGRMGAAAKLGIPTSTLETKIKALKIDKYRFKTAR